MTTEEMLVEAKILGWTVSSVELAEAIRLEQRKSDERMAALRALAESPPLFRAHDI